LDAPLFSSRGAGGTNGQHLYDSDAVATGKEHVLLPLGQLALGQYNQDMKNAKPAYVVYNPPVRGFPFLAVILAADGTVSARAFDTAEEAAAFSHQMAQSQVPGNRTH